MAVAAVVAAITKKGKQNFRTCSSVVVYPVLDGKRQLGPKPPYRSCDEKQEKLPNTAVHSKKLKNDTVRRETTIKWKKNGTAARPLFFCSHLLYFCKRKTRVGSESNLFIAPSLFFNLNFSPSNVFFPKCGNRVVQAEYFSFSLYLYLYGELVRPVRWVVGNQP